MAIECGNPLQVCAMRVTLLDDSGAVADVDDNYYVSDKVIDVGVTPDLKAPTESELDGGCDCTFGTYRGKAKLRRWLFAVNRGALEPALESLLLGATTVNSGNDVLGYAFPDETTCVTAEISVAFEFWMKNWVDDAQDSAWPWWHAVYPSSTWQIGDQTYGLALGPRVLNGFSRTNTAWGQGPYGDGPGIDIRRGAIYLDDVDPPAGVCGFQTVDPGS